jgi:hypothetical protein
MTEEFQRQEIEARQAAALRAHSWSARPHGLGGGVQGGPLPAPPLPQHAHEQALAENKTRLEGPGGYGSKVERVGPGANAPILELRTLQQKASEAMMTLPQAIQLAFQIHQWLSELNTGADRPIGQSTSPLRATAPLGPVTPWRTAQHG